MNKEQENQDSSKKSLTDNEVVFLSSAYNYSFSAFISEKKEATYAKADLVKSDPYWPIEHPPQNLI